MDDNMFQPFNTPNYDTFVDELTALLADHQARIDAITGGDSTSYADVIKPLHDMDEEMSLFFTPLSHLNSICNSEATQKAYEASLPLLSKFGSELSQNEALYAKIREITSDDIETHKVLANDLRDFVLSGVDLPAEPKERIKEINMRLSELSNTFSQNLLDATNAYEQIIEDPADLTGLPQSDIDAAMEERDGREVAVFTLQMPSYLAYMTYGPNRAIRQELYRAYSTRAPQNGAVIDEILALKDEKVKLLGFANYAQYALENRDAVSEEDVVAFLREIATLSRATAQKELNELREFARRLDGIEQLESYDLSYYAEKLKKEQFDFDDTMTKPYFEQSRVVSGMLDIVSELFGVEFRRADIPTWHECVRVYDIYEGDEAMARIYFDLEARKEKRGGAWMHDFETHYIDGAGREHLASAFIVCNFAPTTKNTPSLLRHDDVITLFHEMGHGIHHLFSKAKERSVSGINGVAWDVVEFPSQFLENFAYESAILKRFGFHYESGEPIPDELLKKINDAKNFQAAMGMLRQVEFSLFDFLLHQGRDGAPYQGEEVHTLLESVRAEVAVTTPPSYNRFEHGFSHIFGGGYAAGYYSYKWAEVFSADALFECLDETSGINPIMAQGYKEYILANGGVKEMSELYHEWLGRRPQTKSLLKLYGIEE